MRVVFAGTPGFAATALEALAGAGHDVALVLTQPDRRAGRGLRLAPSAVSQAADRLGLRLAKPPSLRDAPAVDAVRAAQPEVMVVAAYGLILPPPVLALPAAGCLNIHASLLPRWRGAAPVQRAILAGDAETGITIMRMDAGLDTGPMLLAAPTPIGPQDTAGSLTSRLAGLGARTIVAALEQLEALAAVPQDEGRATYAAKVSRAEARLDWTAASADLERRVRAFNPAPGADALVGTELLKVWEAAAFDDALGGLPGDMIAAFPGELRVACGRGSLVLRVVQRPGGRRMDAAEYLRGTPREALKRGCDAENSSH